MSKEKSNYLKLLTEAGISRGTVKAIGAVDRVKYFDQIFSDRVYSTEQIPIGAGQKSDDPVTLARMVDLLGLKKNFRLLEVGTGSGYSTAILSELVKEVITVEYHEELAQRARERLKNDGYTSVRFFCGDASDFSEPIGEFDAVVIFAACARTPYSIINLIKQGGGAVFPMGPALQQQIARYLNRIEAPDINRNFTFYELCSFDSIRGIYGWADVQDIPATKEPAEKP